MNASQDIQPVKNAIQKPEKSPLATDPMKALSMELNAEAEGESMQDDMVVERT